MGLDSDDGFGFCFGSALAGEVSGGAGRPRRRGQYEMLLAVAWAAESMIIFVSAHFVVDQPAIVNSKNLSFSSSQTELSHSC